MEAGSEVVCLVKRAPEAAFGVDQRGIIVAWNTASERLLGWSEAEVLGARCFEVLCGRDVFGNRFCNQACALTSMATRHEAVRRFQMDVRHSSGATVRLEVSVIAPRAGRPDEFVIVHILEPVGTGVTADDLAAGAEGRPAEAELPALSQREIQVLRLLEMGQETADIAARLYISVKTVRNHIQNILVKLGAHSRLEAVYAVRHPNAASPKLIERGTRKQPASQAGRTGSVVRNIHAAAQGCERADETR